MTPAATLLWLSLATPAPEAYYVPGVAMSFAPVVHYWSDTYLVPRWLGRRTLVVESNARPRAVGSEWIFNGRRWVRGKTLAEGAFMIATEPSHRADHLNRAGMTASEFDPWDPSDSARVGLCFMGYLLGYFGYELRPAVAGYNCGRNGAAAWWSGNRALPAETRDYLRKVLYE